jgi:hypothetical protein
VQSPYKHKSAEWLIVSLTMAAVVLVQLSLGAHDSGTTVFVAVLRVRDGLIAGANHRTVAGRDHETIGVVLHGALLCESTLQLFEKASDARESDAKLDALLGRIRELPPDVPIAFESFYARLVAGHYAPEVANRSFVIDFEPSQGDYTKQQIIERDIGRATARAYPDLRTRSLQSLRDIDRFAVVTANMDPGYVGRVAPRHRAKVVHARLFLLEKKE